MKGRILSRLILMSVLVLLGAQSTARAQTGFTLHTFAPASYAPGLIKTNSDGIAPSGPLTWSSNRLYGAAQGGGANGAGTLFSIQTNGTFSLLYAFPTWDPLAGNTFGAEPNGGLFAFSNLLYGTTLVGGGNNRGVIFSITNNGTGIKVLHTFVDLVNTNNIGLFTNKDGASPSAGLIMSGNKLFGTAEYGGTNGNGVIYSLTNTSPFNLTVLRHFTAGNYNTNINPPDGVITNSDGANPTCRLLLLGTNLFGTTSAGGTNGYGTIFRISTNGSSFVVLHHFDTNGVNPYSGLSLSGGKLYGMSGDIIYSLATDGSAFTILHQFDDLVDSSASPAGLMVTNGRIYGVIPYPGYYGNGQVFSLNTNGDNFTVFHDFSFYYSPYYLNYDGIGPNGGLTLANGALYGVASSGGGGNINNGAIFQAGPPPPFIDSQSIGTDLQLSFQTFDALSYTVQQSTNLADGVWINLTSLVGDDTVRQFTVPKTNPVSAFFRVRQP